MGSKLSLYAVVIILLTVTVSLPVLSCVPVIPDEITLPGQEKSPSEAKVIIPDDIDSLLWSSYQVNLDNDVVKLANGNNDFSCDLYRQLINNEDGNFIYSPYSIFLAFAMVYAGARGNTATEIADTIHFNLPVNVPAASKELIEILAQPDTSKYYATLPDGSVDHENRVEIDNYTLNIANALWGREGYPFLPQYIETVDSYYGAGLESLDFSKPEESAEIINKWIAEQTEDLITDLISPGNISHDTRLIITNALYFYARWQSEFNKKNTEDKPFHLLNGEVTDVPTMQGKKSIVYTEGDGYKAVRLGYKGGDLDMVIILPDIDKFESFEQSLDSPKLKTIVNSMERRQVDLALPKFEYRSKYLNMGQTLQEMGMTNAFTPAADFSGMTEAEKLWIGQVLHETFIHVDEEGTEAAAATAVIMVGASGPPPPATFIVDHPFIYFIRHQKTGVILFMGRVLNPAE